MKSLAAELAHQAKQAAKIISTLDEKQKDHVLNRMATQLRLHTAAILQANAEDINNARLQQLNTAMLDRLLLNETRIANMADAILQITKLEDPVGKVRELGIRPNGIKVYKMRIPLGVIAMIYEARPNVTADAGPLCFKSGNAVILRCGREALASSQAIAKAMHIALAENDLPTAAITVVPDPSRDLMLALLQQRELIDLVIPRGGEGLIHFITEHSRIPVIQHFKGVCHLYVDKSANLEKALALLVNGKTQRPGVCNALESLLVHSEIAPHFFPVAAEALQNAQVKIYACPQSAHYFKNPQPANDEEYAREYLDLAISIRQVETFENAVEHIQRFGSQHTEVICSEDDHAIQRFLREIDAAVVMANASSRFSDGGELGLGAEIGISTSKLHAYGPMGLEALTTEKFMVLGNGQIRNT